MQREDGKVPNSGQLCSKNRPGSELRNSTADICIRTWPRPPFFSLSVLQILRHRRPTETFLSIPKTAESNFSKRTTFCYHKLQSWGEGKAGIHRYTLCCSAKTRRNLSRGIPCVGLIPSLELVQIWEDSLSSHCDKQGLGTQRRNSRNKKY